MPFIAPMNVLCQFNVLKGSESMEEDDSLRE